MSAYLFNRVAQALFVLWAAFTISFVLLQAMPGDAILIKFQNPDLGLTAEQVAEIRASYAVDSSVPVQYARTIG